MLSSVLVVAFLLSTLSASFGQADKCHPAASPEFKRPAYVPLDRSEEDWSILKNATLRSDPWDPLKYIPLRHDSNWYLTLAGEERSFYELYRNYNWGVGPQDGNGYYLNRFHGSSDFHFGPSTRVFVEFKSGFEFGRTGGPRSVQDEDKLDLNQLFMEFRTPSQCDQPSLSLKLGRQELQYGEGALLDVRDLNVRRSFDGLKVVVRTNDWRIDLFGMKPDLSEPGYFDDYPDHTQTLWGGYGITTKHLPRFMRQIDLYYLGLDRKSARFAEGSARDQRHEVGSLMHGGKKAFSYFTEGDLQFGQFGSSSILAWKFAQNLSYSLSSLRFQPVASLFFAISSGDKNPTDPNLETFYPYFPKGLYYGVIDDSGSLNAIVLHQKISLQISKKLSLVPDNYFFWRQRPTDGLYSQPGILLRSGLNTQARYVGALQDFAANWVLDTHTTFQLLGAYYEVGPFLRDTSPPGRNIGYVSGKVIYRF